jgi:DNA-binding transcriptional ArsR family regulator
MNTAAPVFAALAEPTRLVILDALATGERTVGRLVRRAGVSQPAVSQHLKVLREAGLVRVRPDAQRRLYSLEPAGFHVVDAWLERHRRAWADRLDALEQHMDDSPQKEDRR